MNWHSTRGLTLDELIMQMGKIQHALFQVSKKRVAPSIDDKVLTDWNGLMIAALARAGRILGEKRYLEAAKKTADFFLMDMLVDDVLYHRYVKGERAVEGFLDDYAFLAFGLIELYEAVFEEKYLKAASALTKSMAAKFWDTQNGGFYQTQNIETSLPKIKQLYDGATPSGNSVALNNLLWLSRLIDEPKYDAMAAQMAKTFAEEVEGAPDAYTFFLSALDFMIGPSFSVVWVGDQKAKDTADMLAALKKHYQPFTVMALKSPSQAGLGYQQIEGKATAYVCQNQTCMPATNDPQVMLQQLGIKE